VCLHQILFNEIYQIVLKLLTNNPLGPKLCGAKNGNYVARLKFKYLAIARKSNGRHDM